MSANSASGTEPVAARVDADTAARLEYLAESPVTEFDTMSEATATAIRQGLGLESADN